MAVEKYTPKRPEYLIAKFYGRGAVEDILALAGTDEYTLSQQRHGREVMEVAGLTLKYQDLLIKEPNGTLRVMEKGEIHNFEPLGR